MAKELRLCPKNSEELMGGFKRRYRIRAVVQKDCPDRVGERRKKTGKPGRLPPSVHREMPVP